MKYRRFFLYTFWYFSLFLLLIAPGGCRQVDNKEEAVGKGLLTGKIDTTGVLIKYNDNLFSLPSPYEAVYMISEQNLSVDAELLNSPDHHSRYNTSFKKALNIGIYGTDMGYLHIFNHDEELSTYFKAIRNLSRDLGLHEALSEREIKLMKNSLTAGDSTIFYLTRTYRRFDAYLKQSNRRKTGALILAGGWVESNYLLSQTILKHPERPLVNRLGEQKHVLDNLIELLSSYYYDADKYTQLIDAMVDIAYEFDGVIYNYYYKDPLVKEDEKLTVIRSTSNVVISEYHLRTIAEKLSNLRNQIIS